MKAIRWPWLAAIAMLLSSFCFSIPAPAAVEMSTGIRYVAETGSVDECSAKAKTALNTYLQGASESSPGSGEWIAFSRPGIAGTPVSAATVRCYPVAKGYVVTFTCAVQLPDSPYGADALCLDVAHNFSGKAVTPLAAIPTPTPIPTGCSTVNLVGTWVSDDKPDLTFKMELNGDLTDNEGVSGNWGLVGSTVTLTYYGNHTLTLSPDGKHARGGGYNLTRKC